MEVLVNLGDFNRHNGFNFNNYIIVFLIVLISSTSSLCNKIILFKNLVKDIIIYII